MSRPRIHRVTHPVIGLATWREIQAARERIKNETGDRVCSWCHRQAKAPRRTSCGSEECDKHVRRAQSWSFCRWLILFIGGRNFAPCALCSKPAFEVDHIIPMCLGGTGDPENLRPLCEPCHLQETRRLARMKAAYIAQTVRA